MNKTGKSSLKRGTTRTNESIALMANSTGQSSVKMSIDEGPELVEQKVEESQKSNKGAEESEAESTQRGGRVSGIKSRKPYLCDPDKG